ncbi:electron transfer flavoprotein subunit alpha/FixB family protein [Sulfoacidibacillus thermotolerans]|uniref:Electron transfer flavoprotein subunit alpha n=1 Tax=Sulfoacidibacillus thermotolerans TaxID=1765684 RepID=A0A2U3DAP3_SULT2|nr:electron transfer flavoprotein subunit alpha/FixB family protein [Sulfoacidibacillus thermotolerans]PWI58356.1 electron transfer flavoprotein subunit alpha [Sulfoacidibacillus thermotolerans]
MKRNVLVIADLRGNQLRNVTFETLGAAHAIADGGTVAAAVIGHEISALAQTLGEYGAQQVYVVDHPELAQYIPDAYVAAVSQVMQAFAANVVLFAHSAMGRDVAPLLAAKHKAGQISDIIHVELAGDDVLFTRPIYAGKAFMKVKAAGDLVFATVRPNNLPMPEHVDATATVTSITYEVPEKVRTRVREVVKKASTGVDLSEAKIIVSGGRGVKSAEGFKPLTELAEVLGAAVGASRGACDAGYCDYSMQIGQTGKVVTPDLYIACGISGAIQHLAGMSNSKVIVAINKDPEAPIFKVADYGIVGDLFEIVPALTQEVRKVLA